MVSYEQIAEYAFMVFVVIAIVIGLAIGGWAWSTDKPYPQGLDDEDIADARGWTMLIMVILGIIVGLISITAKEVTPFLIAAIALTVIRREIWEPLGRISDDALPYLASGIIEFIVAFVAPAAVIIAIKSVWALSRKK